MQIATVFSKIVDLALANGHKDISKMPGCLEMKVDDQWSFSLNGHKETTASSEGIEVPPYTAYVVFNGWPAGFIDSSGGCMAAGFMANEDALIFALDKAIEECKCQSS